MPILCRRPTSTIGSMRMRPVSLRRVSLTTTGLVMGTASAQFPTTVSDKFTNEPRCYEATANNERK